MVCLVHRRMQLLALPSVHFHFRWVSRFVCIEKSNPILCWGAFLLWLSHVLIIIRWRWWCCAIALKMHQKLTFWTPFIFSFYSPFLWRQKINKIFSLCYDKVEKNRFQSISKAPFILCEVQLWKGEPWKDEKEKLKTQTLFLCHWASSSSTSFTKGCEEKLSLEWENMKYEEGWIWII